MAKSIVTHVLQRYWRHSRGLSLSVRALVIDPEGRVLLVRGSGGRGWDLPGTRVERGETVAGALARELSALAGITAGASPELFAFYAGPARSPAAQIALLVLREWRQARTTVDAERRGPGMETAFFGLAQLPAGTEEAVRARIQEVLQGRQRAPSWQP